MAIVEELEQHSATAETTPVASFTSLGRALALVARGLWPLAIGAVVVVCALQLLSAVFPGRGSVIRQLSVDYLVVLAQQQRAETVPAADIGFLGDSSCLMGIYVPRLPARLGTAESYCTLAYLGPEGYGAMLSSMMQRGTAPKKLVLVFHPTGFQRDPSWDSWLAVVKDPEAFLAARAAADNFPQSALDFLRFDLIGKLIYSPLPGQYGIYYGGYEPFMSTIAANHGSGVDPTNLKVHSLVEAEAITSAAGKPFDYTLSDRFRLALGKLTPVLRKFGLDRVYLAVAPVPDFDFPSGAAEARDTAANAIASSLGLAPSHILTTPGSYPTGYFSTVTHLNRIGRLGFTDDLSGVLMASDLAVR